MQVPVLVDDGQDRQVVGCEQTRHGRDVRVGVHGLNVAVQDRAEQGLWGLAQRALDVDHAQVLAGRCLLRRACDESDGRDRGRDVLASHGREHLRDGRVGAENDGLGGHERTRGRLVVGHESTHVLGLFGLHEGEQGLSLRGGQLGDEVGRVVGLHDVQDVGGSGGFQRRDDRDTVVLTQLLEHVGEARVRQLHGDRHLAVLGERVHEVRQVGGAHVLRVLQQRGRRLVRVGLEQTRHLGHVDREGLAAARETEGGRAHALDVQRGDHPVLRTALTHRDVEDTHLARAVVHGDDAVEELGEHERLDGTLRERTNVEQARRDDRAGLDRGHSGERQEDTLTRADLDDEADDVGFGFQPKDDNDIVDLADLVAQRVENTGASELSDVDAAALGA